MHLYIHFGIYKAGSSYLQYVCANSTQYLLEQGYYFPESSAHTKMRQGEISPGNALSLAHALKAEDTNQVNTIITTWKQGASAVQSSKVLISAEALVHQLAIPKRLELLLTTLKQLGFTGVHAMGFFRELDEHALSTYKHRAKAGQIPDYIHWLRNSYETPDLLNKLLIVRRASLEIQWTFRKFVKNDVLLKEAFFKDWLKMNVPDFKGKPTVNDSLTLAEVMLMNELVKYYPRVMDVFVDKLKSLPSSEKALSKELDQAFLNQARTILKDRGVDLTEFNHYMPENEALHLSANEEQVSPAQIPAVLNLSKKQMSVVLEAILYLQSFEGALLKVRRLTRQFLPEPLVKWLVRN